MLTVLQFCLLFVHWSLDHDSFRVVSLLFFRLRLSMWVAMGVVLRYIVDCVLKCISVGVELGGYGHWLLCLVLEELLLAWRLHTVVLLSWRFWVEVTQVVLLVFLVSLAHRRNYQVGWLIDSIIINGLNQKVRTSCLLAFQAHLLGYAWLVISFAMARLLILHRVHLCWSYTLSVSST